MTLPDQHARDRIATDLATTFIVEAAAGTGKTTALISRLLALLEAGHRLSGIAAVTFTEKAAGEMKLRLRSAIEAARRQRPQAREALDRALAELETAHIGTIHGLCAEILRERPIEAGLDPRFEVVDDVQAGRLYDEVFARWYEGVLADPPEGIRRLLRRTLPGAASPREVLRRAGRAQCDRRDFRGPWARTPFDRDAALDAAVEALRTLVPWAARDLDPTHHLVRNVREIAAWVSDLDAREALHPRDHDALEAALHALSRWRSWRHVGPARPCGPDTPRDALRAVRDRVRDVLAETVARCDADLAPKLDEALWPLVDAYVDRLSRAGAVDYFSLLERTRDLLARDGTVRRALQDRFTHLLVDEFQDTDPLQADLLLLLAAADPDETDPARVRVVPGKLFLVGDPKQSIYRFRRADVASYLALRDRLVADGAVVLHLSTSFRADPRIQAVVNRAFAPRMTGGTQADHVPLHPWRPAVEGRPAVVALPVPSPYGAFGDRPFAGAVADSLPTAIAAWIRWLCDESGWRVLDPATGRPVPVAPHHVCLLFRRFQGRGTGIAAPYAAALDAAGLPHVLVGGRSLHDREEVSAIQTALTAIEWPDDELAVHATLRGPLFAVPDDALLLWRHRVGSLDPLRRVDRDALPGPCTDVADALDVLARLHRGRNHRSIASTLARLLEETRAHAGFALWAGGHRVLANVLRIVDLARRFEAAGATSFRAFVDHLADQAERGGAGEAPVVEEGAEGVRLMTVHRAKGLEYPVVILADIGCPRVRRAPGRWVDPKTRRWVVPIAGCIPQELRVHRDTCLALEEEEADRLLYVAATRARDLLVVPAVGDMPLPGWVDALHPSLYPPPERWRQADPPPGCPPFGPDATVHRRSPRAPDPGSGVRPGLHAWDGLEVVWWDAHLLGPPGDGDTGFLRQTLHLLTADDGGCADQNLARHARWARRRDEALRRGAVPSHVVTTPTARAASLAASGAGDDRPVAWHHVPRPADRPEGPRFGTLVHAILETIPLDADAATVGAHAHQHGRLLGCPADEIHAAISAVEGALDHPLLRRARSADEVRREDAIVHQLPDGTLLEGTVDLAFREADTWVVVDFKTDRDPGERRPIYEAQVRLYARAIEAATGMTASAHLLGV